MPGRPLRLDFRCRDFTICRSCLLSTQRRLPNPQFVAPYSSRAARRTEARQELRARAQAAQQPDAAELQKYFGGAQFPEEGGSGESSDFEVHYYEQGEDGARKELKDEQEFGRSLDGIDDSLFSDGLESIRNSLDPESKGGFQDLLQTMGIDWKSMRTMEDVEQGKAKLEARVSAMDAEIDEVTAEMPEELRKKLKDLLSGFGELDDKAQLPQVPQIPEKSWTANQRRKVERLNQVIEQVSRQLSKRPDITQRLVMDVYKAYHASRAALARGWNNVPIDVWDFLWKIFSADENVSPNRLAHISLLARDMGAAKVELSPQQQILTIEAVFVDGWESKALDSWKRCRPLLGREDAETFKDFWELGVRMFCRLNDMDQAEHAADRLLEKQMDPAILMTLIRAYSERGTPEAKERAWNLYRELRGLFGQNMKLTHYDQVISYFLTNNQVESALYAFVDMMSDGQIDLKQQQKMPSVVANKFFVGKWLKRLIGAGDLDGAYKVIEFMRKRGVTASAIQLNGLIGAWQRSGGSRDLESADRLGWEMIESRLQFVRNRELPKASRVEKASDNEAAIPRASLETFSLLAESYRLRGLHGDLERLWDASHDAKISPNAFMINQLLESYIQFGQWREALQTYQAFVTDRGVKPDPFTFSALWKTPAVNRLHVLPSEDLAEETDTTRSLFAETAKFRDALGPEAIDGQLARKILHTFRRLKDSGGFIVALASLRYLFNFLPTETLVLEVILGTTKLSWEQRSQRRRLLEAKRDMDFEIASTLGVEELETLDVQQRSEALYDYLHKKYWRMIGAKEENRGQLADIARQMGVYELLSTAEGGSVW